MVVAGATCSCARAGASTSPTAQGWLEEEGDLLGRPRRLPDAADKLGHAMGKPVGAVMW